MVWCLCTGAANQFRSLLAPSKSHLFFTYSHRPILDDADIFTSSLLLYNSFKYNLIDTKLDAMVHLPITYMIPLSHMTKMLAKYCMALYL